ncbi:MAG: hypothetical protein A3J28_13025 [Acidobacteria bacterium RIFCSPLOWO2_12_FULL_60_22]|nr:MAG: hypothetical protein A3J28_13025 [Acidobacteria bacterium RIFCSPLOWO2_12_FULL_60_22]
MNILIQYEGCVVALGSRVYNFLVVDALGVSRQFTVKVSTESFSSSSLKFQDGPPISFERVKHALDAETQAMPATAHLHIGEGDIQEYLGRHYPRKRA